MPEPRSDAASSAAPALHSLDVHPMDPRRGPNLSPRFAALLCWLLDLPSMTNPAIVDVAVIGNCVFAATTEDRSFNVLLGSWDDCRANLRGWGAACDAPIDTVDALIETVRIGGGTANPNGHNAPASPAHQPRAS